MGGGGGTLVLLLWEPLKLTKKSIEKEDLMTKKSNEIIEVMD